MIIKILLNYIFGYIRISIEGYYIERFINICRKNKLTIWNLKRDKNVKLELNIGIRDLKKVAKIAKQTQCKLKIIKRRGIPFIFNKYIDSYANPRYILWDNGSDSSAKSTLLENSHEYNI